MFEKQAVCKSLLPEDSVGHSCEDEPRWKWGWQHPPSEVTGFTCRDLRESYGADTSGFRGDIRKDTHRKEVLDFASWRFYTRSPRVSGSPEARPC